MNYVSLVMAIFALYAVAYWFIRARKQFVVPTAKSSDMHMQAYEMSI